MEDKTSTDIFEKWKESLPIQKEHLKFIIGLSTGTLVFSITFFDKNTYALEYQWIAIIGWVFLLVTVVTGVSMLNSLHDYSGAIETIKKWKDNPAYFKEGFTDIPDYEKEFKPQIEELTSNKKMVKFLKINKHVYRLYAFFRQYRGPVQNMRTLRNSYLKLEILPLVNTCSFYFGIILIGIFGIVNFI
jgi:hypothetical protein